MDRDHGAASLAPGADEGRSRKGRLMGKLFGGRERKTVAEPRADETNDANINAFLHGSPNASSSAFGKTASPPSSAGGSASFDTFQVAHSTPPQLAKLDTRAAARYPNALPVNHHTNPSQQSLPSSQRSRTPPPSYQPASRPLRQSRRGLMVRFTDTYPEIIGEGGEDAELPAAEIGRRRHAHAGRPPPSPMHNPHNLQHIQSMALPMRAAQPSQPSQSSLPSPALPSLPSPRNYAPPKYPTGDDDFVPRQLKRTQTGFSSVYSDISSPDDDDQPSYLPSQENSPPRRPPLPAKLPSGELAASGMSRDDSRRSFIEIHQAEMREAEGRALANALHASVSPPSSPEAEERRPPLSPSRRSPNKMDTMVSTSPVPPPRHPGHHGLPVRAEAPKLPALATSTPLSTPSSDRARAERYKQLAQDYSPSDSLPQSTVERAHSKFRRAVSGSLSVHDRGANAAAVPSRPDLHDTVQMIADEAYGQFAERTRHLFELFRLHSETVRPLSSSTGKDLARAALWWFVIGRMALENAIRGRTAAASAGGQVSRGNEFTMQQAYADLAKAYWILEEVLPEILATKPSAGDAEVGPVRAVLVSSLRKLAMSMKRNDLLPPEDAFLPQTIDKAIWAVYPPVSSDVTALLWGNWASGLSTSGAAGATAPMTILEAIPVADNAQDFVFSRIWVDVYLTEQGGESYQQRLHFPCLLTVARPQSLPTPEAIIASQNGTVQLRVQSRKSQGPTWDEVRWRPDACVLELRMPRGFLLVVQLSKTDYGLLWSMYDFGIKVHSQLYPRKDEHAVFRTTLRAFQYFEAGAGTGSFPKEAVADCEVALFEKVLPENAATGRRHFHRGFRFAVVSGTRTRTLYGASQLYLPELPVQFSFLRGDYGDPALMLRFENSRSKGSMVLTFGNEDERMRFHTLLAGTAVHSDEQVVADVPVTAVQVVGVSGSGSGAEAAGSSALSVFQKLSFDRLRVINYDDEADDTQAATVLAEHLRVVLEVGDCTVTDRINVAPGELKVRADVRDSTRLVVLRQAQKDLTVAVSDVQVSRETGRELAEGLRAASTGPTCRVLRFPSVAELHAVQAAITGYAVVFDGTATTFAIARRRMVVPIHKKWEAGTTRIQVVVQADTKVTQLLAFFHDFHYGRSMSFVLKGTDVFEAFGRGSKAGLKIDDAKFPLPRMAAEGGGGGGGEYDEGAFVCLDMPDLPGEHDDISILFDKEAERDRLAACLPAPVRGARLGKKF